MSLTASPGRFYSGRGSFIVKEFSMSNLFCLIWFNMVILLFIMFFRDDNGILMDIPSGKRLYKELENHHAINGKTHCK